MLLRIGRDRDLEIGDALDAGDEIGGVAIAVGMRRVALADAAERIAAQRHDVAHARRHIGCDHLVDLGAGRRHAGEMRGGRERRLGEDALDRRVGALAGRAAGAVGDRDEVRRERREPRDRLPQGLLHLLGLRREELEGDADARVRGCGSGWRAAAVRAPSRDLARGRRCTMRGSRASQSDTAILPSESRLRRQAADATTPSRPACSSHCVTVSGAKPSRRWRVLVAQEFELVRREIDHQQPAAGRSTRAASRIARPPSSRKCSTWWMMTTSKESRGSARS